MNPPGTLRQQLQAQDRAVRPHTAEAGREGPRQRAGSAHGQAGAFQSRLQAAKPQAALGFQTAQARQRLQPDPLGRGRQEARHHGRQQLPGEPLAQAPGEEGVQALICPAMGWDERFRQQPQLAAHPEPRGAQPAHGRGWARVAAPALAQPPGAPGPRGAHLKVQLDEEAVQGAARTHPEPLRASLQEAGLAFRARPGEGLGPAPDQGGSLPDLSLQAQSLQVPGRQEAGDPASDDDGTGILPQGGHRAPIRVVPRSMKHKCPQQNQRMVREPASREAPVGTNCPADRRWAAWGESGQCRGPHPHLKKDLVPWPFVEPLGLTVQGLDEGQVLVQVPARPEQGQ